MLSRKTCQCGGFEADGSPGGRAHLHAHLSWEDPPRRRGTAELQMAGFVSAMELFLASDGGEL